MNSGFLSFDVNMKWLIFTFVLINFSATTFGRICSKNVPVRVSRSVLRTTARVTSFRNWMGFVKTQWTPYTYTEIEYSIITRLEYDCCAGYTHEGTLCKPICPTGCPDHSYCNEPYQCKCRDAYIWSYNNEGERICKPKCKNDCPKYSNCTAPEICSCYPGYDFSFDKKECLPMCKEICPENAYCESPNVCKCNEGYESILSNDNIMKCQSLCINGCTLNAHCTLPNQCSCDDGYKMIDGLCEPHCEPACALHNVCFEPNYCICERGYKFSVDQQKCTPVCSLGCPAYSVCVEAETCDCEPGYTMNVNATQCHPICIAPCPEHSVCYKPDECLCDEGYRLKQFPDINRTLECETICPDNCLPYGKCDPLNGCECYPGYVLRRGLVNTKQPLCQPRCNQSCENGFCFSPDVCVCNPGYLMGPKNVCHATCSMGCINGDCIEPEICVCKKGYRQKENSVSECEPICEPDCENGDCVAPNICLCWQDYQPTAHFDLTNACEPSYENEESTLFPLNTTTMDQSFSSTANTRTSLTTDESEFVKDLPGMECFPYCKCWQKVGNDIPLGFAKCANICADGADKPCLNLETCFCNLNIVILNCTLEEESFESERTTIEYYCAESFQRSTDTTNEKHTKAFVNGSKFDWFMILSCAFVAVIVLVLFSVVLALVRNKSGGHYVVEFENH